MFLYSCSGYKPIFSSTNLNFEISNHSVSGDRILGNQLYAQIKKSSQKSKAEKSPYNFDIFIDALKNKEATTKSSTGKILEYRITAQGYFLITEDMPQK